MLPTKLLFSTKMEPRWDRYGSKRIDFWAKILPWEGFGGSGESRGWGRRQKWNGGPRIFSFMVVWGAKMWALGDVLALGSPSLAVLGPSPAVLMTQKIDPKIHRCFDASWNRFFLDFYGFVGRKWSQVSTKMGSKIKLMLKTPKS